MRRTTPTGFADVYESFPNIILTRARRTIATACVSLEHLRHAEALDATTQSRLDDLAAMLDLRRAELLLLRAGLAAWDEGATGRSDA